MIDSINEMELYPRGTSQRKSDDFCSVLEENITPQLNPEVGRCCSNNLNFIPGAEGIQWEIVIYFTYPWFSLEKLCMGNPEH